VRSRKRALVVLAVAAWPVMAGTKQKKPQNGLLQDQAPPLEEYIRQAQAALAPEPPSPGSIFTPGGTLADPSRDIRASRVGDLVTILVSENSSALSSGVVNTQRKSSAAASIGALGGPLRANGLWQNLANTSGNQQLQGQGTTSRQTTVTTNVSAQVVSQLANGNLIVEGKKWIVINSERQEVIIRGILRPVDLSLTNTIPSDSLAQLEVLVNGKGVVADSIKRPFFLYRLLLGLLPF
jgi:flagellar L-ring protein precursor FlgH